MENNTQKSYKQQRYHKKYKVKCLEYGRQCCEGNKEIFQNIACD